MAQPSKFLQMKAKQSGVSYGNRTAEPSDFLRKKAEQARLQSTAAPIYEAPNVDAMVKERNTLLRRLEQTGVSDNARIAQLNESLNALGYKEDGPIGVIKRVRAGEKSVRQSTFGGLKGAAAMALNTLGDINDRSPAALSEKKGLENSAANISLYEQKLSEATTDEERKEWEMRVTAAKRAQQLLDGYAGRYDPLDEPIAKLTESALENYEKSAQYQQEAIEGLSGAGRTVADTALTLGNQAAPVLAGMALNPAAGALMLGATASGNAYLGKLAEGEDEDKARAYGTIVGTLEGGLQYLLGGISSLGGKLVKGSGVSAKIEAMESGLKKAAAYLVYHNVSEITEEEAQLFLEPLVNSLVFNEEYDVPTIEEMAYTALITALSTGVLEAPATIATGLSPSTQAVSNRQAEAILGDETALAQLREMAGLELTDDMTQAQRRNAVKDAVNRAQSAFLASETQTANDTPVTENAPTAKQGASIEKYARVMGEEGAQAIREQYDGVQDETGYAATMFEAYDAGREGKALESVRNIGATQEQVNAAYLAGMNDKAKVVIYKKSAGIDYTDATTKEYVESSVDKKTAKTLDIVAKALGVKVRFAEYGTVGGGKANAEIAQGIVTIEKNNENPLRFLFGHEITHRMQELAPAEYARLRAAIEARSGIRERVQLVQNNAAKHGDTLSYTEALDEVVADEIGLLLENSGEMERFIRKHSDDRTLLEKLRDVVRTIIKKLGNSPEAKRFRETEKLLSAALDKSVETVKKSEQTAEKNTTESGGVKYAMKSKTQLGRLDPRTVTKQDVTDLLHLVEDGTIYGNTYIPVRIGTPSTLIYWAERRNGDVIDNNPIAISAEKAYNAMNRAGTNESGKPNKLSVNDIIAMVESMNNPQYIVYQGANDRYVEVVKFDTVSGDTAFAVIEIANEKDSVYMNGFEGGLYNILVTTYPPLEGKLKELLRAPNNKVIYDKKKDASQRTSSSTVPSVLNDASFYEDILPENTEKVNGKFSRKDALTQEIARIQREGKELGHSDAEIQAEIRAAVDEAYGSMIEAYGTMEAGENPAREISVPKRTSKNEKVSQTVRTILEAEATPDVVIPDIEQLIAEGEFSYESYTDKEAIADATAKIGGAKGQGWENAYAEWDKAMDSGKVSKANTTMGWVLYNNAANEGDAQLALDILNKMVEHQRNAAQALQATRILKKLSPDAQLYGAQRSVANLQRELTEKYGKKAPDLKIDTELAERFLRARTDEGRAAAMRDIYRDIGRQMPSRFIDKWNAWRYLAMLGNARTHVRNIAGNAFFAPVVATKNLTATAIESAVSRVSGGKIQRSKAFVGVSQSDRALLSAAWNDFTNVQESIGGGKYSDFANANKYIEEGRQIFGAEKKIFGSETLARFSNKTVGAALETARKGNSAALGREDAWFSQPHYAYALAQYCKANGISAEQIASGKWLDVARKYAIVEAQKATYQDANAFSQTISRFLKIRGNDWGARIVNTLSEGILPFRKTPANILVRGVEYSPLGLSNGIKQAVWDVKHGNKTAAEAIDSISAGLTGTGLLALGILAAAEGLVRGHGGDDEKENEFEELMGHQAYSLEVGGTSVTLDWLAPECLPFFVGVNLWEQTKGKIEELTLSEIFVSITTVTEPLLEMTCLQSLNSAFDAIAYAKEGELSSISMLISDVATSYLTQGLPTILGQAERSGEKYRMTTYTEKNAFLTSDMQYTLGKASARIPGWEYQQIPYIDAWGREETTGKWYTRSFNNFINPSYTSSLNESKMEKALLDLYERTGESSVLPKRASKYFTVKEDRNKTGIRKDLTAEEYVKYAKKKGTTSYDLITKLVNSKQYSSMSDEQKVAAVEKCYDYAEQIARASVSKHQVESWVEKAQKTKTTYGVPVETYISLSALTSGIESLKDKDGETIENSQSLQIMEAVYNVPGLTEEQRKALFEKLGVGKEVRHYSKKLVESKLESMRKKAQG